MKEIQSQISFFDGSTPFKINKPIRLIELFAGIGAQAKALERLQAEGLCEFEHYRICEFDRFAVASYNAVHGTDFQTSDITQLKGEDLGITDTDKYCYIMTYSFPCTDLSLAGKQEGMAKGSGTRSGLLWEVERLLNEVDELPQVLLMENVPQVICEDFFEWCRFLEGKGYKQYYNLMNSRDFGVPQNRNRCFMISLLGDYSYTFPSPIPLEKRLKDLLEDSVDEKYYLNDKAVKFVMKRLGKYTQLVGGGTPYTPSAITACGNANWTGNFVEEHRDTMNEIKCNEIGTLEGGMYDKLHEQSKRVYAIDGLSPAVHTMGGGGQELKILEPLKSEKQIRIRKLTPKECWRLMDFDDADFEKARKVNSNSRLFKQAGNSIAVNCLYLIFKELM